MSETKPKVLLWFGLGLWPPDEEMERSWIAECIEAVRHVDGVLLKLPSMYEAPDGLGHWLVQRMIRLCQGRNVDLYLGRNLWVSWPRDGQRVQNPDDVFDPVYYAAALACIQAEAKAIDAVGTCFDAEPYGKSVFKDSGFKKTGFEENGRWLVGTALESALTIVPPVDFIHPGSSMSPDHYCWTLRPLAREYLHPRTYQARSVADVRIDPPAGTAPELHWWGVHLKATGEAGKGPLLVEEYVALKDNNWEEIKAAFPECKGMWLFIGRDDRLKVLKQLGKLEDK